MANYITKVTVDGKDASIKDTETSSNLSKHVSDKNNPHGVTKAQVGLGNVANLDQSKAIKSITRYGTTFTATALDGSKFTFNQQDSNTTYGRITNAQIDSITNR